MRAVRLNLLDRFIIGQENEKQEEKKGEEKKGEEKKGEENFPLKWRCNEYIEIEKELENLLNRST